MKVKYNPVETSIGFLASGCLNPTPEARGAKRPLAGALTPRQQRVRERTAIMARIAEVSRKQTFRFADPTAMSVLLVGDFTQWQAKGIPMRKGKDGIWVATLELPPGKHTYRFIVDGEWRDDPECTLRVDNPYGGKDMVRQVA